MKNYVEHYKRPSRAHNLSLVASCKAEAWWPIVAHPCSWNHVHQVKNSETCLQNFKTELGLNRSLVIRQIVGHGDY